jgi:undecaprenyl-diphosphatase
VYVIARLLAVDAAVAALLNAAVRRSAPGRLIAGSLARQLAGVEVVLMVLLALTGRGRQAGRMLLAVGVVYVASEGAGLAWKRNRPFAETHAQALVDHAPDRSFPSRHVASGLAMAVIGAGASPRLGRTMAGVAWLLGVSRVAAGLHYPSDVLVGALLGLGVGRLLAGGPQEPA